MLEKDNPQSAIAARKSFNTSISKEIEQSLSHHSRKAIVPS
jgi:hypothetical protein